MTTAEKIREVFNLDELEILKAALEKELSAQVSHREFIRQYAYYIRWDEDTLRLTERMYSLLDKAVEEYKEN